MIIDKIAAVLSRKVEPPVQKKSPYDRNCDFCGPGWTGAHKHRCPRAIEDYAGGPVDD